MKKTGAFGICRFVLLLVLISPQAYSSTGLSATLYSDQSTKACYQWTLPTSGFPYSTSNYCCCYSPANSPTYANEFDSGYMCTNNGGYLTRMIRRGIFRFNIGSGLPSGITVTSATFYADAAVIKLAQTMYLYSTTND